MNQRRDIILLILLSFCYLLLFGSYASPLNPYDWADTAIYKTMGNGWLHGVIPYRDLFDNKGPYLYLFNAAGLSLNVGKWGTFILEVINLTLVLALFKKTVLLIYPRQAAGWTVILLFLLFFTATIGEGGSCEEWSLLFLALPLWIFVRFTQSKQLRHPYRYTFIYGLCFGVTSLIRLNNGTLIAAIILTLLVFYIIRGWAGQLLLHMFSFVLGMACTTIPMLLYFKSKGALEDLVFANFTYNFIYRQHYKELNAAVILKSLLLLIPLLATFATLCAKRFLTLVKRNKFVLKSKSRRFSQALLWFVFSMTSALLYLYFFHNSWGYNHYFTLLIPLCIPTFTLLLRLPIRPLWKVLAISVCFLPFTQFAARCVAKNVVLNGIYANESLYLRIGDVPQAPPRNVNAIYDQMLAHIPQSERDSIAAYNLFPHSDFFTHAKITPIGRYFYLQDQIFNMVDDIRQQHHTFYEQTPPLWVVASTSIGDERIQQILEEQYVTCDTAGEIRLMHRKEK